MKSMASRGQAGKDKMKMVKFWQLLKLGDRCMKYQYSLLFWDTLERFPNKKAKKHQRELLTKVCRTLPKLHFEDESNLRSLL